MIAAPQPGTGFLQKEGSFVLDCNYWASHAGTATWADERTEVVLRGSFPSHSGGALEVGAHDAAVAILTRI